VIIRVFNQFPECPGNERRWSAAVMCGAWPGPLAIVCAMPSLPEDLVILAVGAKPRSGPSNGKPPWRFVYGMLGAVLVALTLAGRVEIADGQIVVRNPSPLGDPNLDEALAGLAAVRTVPVAQWMTDKPGGFVTAWLERLEARLAGLAGQDPAMAGPGMRPGTGTSDDPFMHATQAAVHSAVHHSVHAAVSAAATTSHHSGGSSPDGDSSPTHHHH
jgi:hypothetical protein